MADTTILTLDGAGGGGQLLRTAISLSIVTDTAFELADIRGTRPDPGLNPQHLAAVEVGAEMCGAETDGATLESDHLTFDPGSERHHTLEVDIGTAGSITLLFDTVMPVAATWDDPVTVRATGGTDVKWAPTMAYMRQVKLPLLARWGLDARIEVDRTGFYPAGGGEATLEVHPSSLSSVALDSRGDLDIVEIYSTASESLESQNVADRQAEHAATTLEDAGVPFQTEQVAYVPADSPGSSIVLRAVYGESIAGFDSLGEPGLPSEDVAAAAVDQFLAFHDGDAPLDAHMADQLLVWLAIAGGSIRIPCVTSHVETNLDLIRAFGSDMARVGTDDAVGVTASPLECG